MLLFLLKDVIYSHPIQEQVAFLPYKVLAYSILVIFEYKLKNQATVQMYRILQTRKTWLPRAYNYNVAFGLLPALHQHLAVSISKLLLSDKTNLYRIFFLIAGRQLARIHICPPLHVPQLLNMPTVKQPLHTYIHGFEVPRW